MDCGTCGDLDCDISETAESCPSDCVEYCGDFECEPGEEETCAEDCETRICGDDLCQAGEEADCPLDCLGSPALCFEDSECDDGNPCTADFCDGGAGCANTPLPDQDGDGSCDAIDGDDDNDGVSDSADGAPFDPKACQDLDADTCDDCAVGVDGFGSSPDFNPAKDGPDNDGDGACDAGDPDDDNDGLADVDETVTDPFDPDTDDDGACDGPLAVSTTCSAGPDNCPITANPGQSDVDADDLGDACDPSPVDDVSGLVPCNACPADLPGVEIPGVPAFPDKLIGHVTCSTEQGWKNHGAYVSSVTHLVNFLDKYLNIDGDALKDAAASSACGK
ncbi:MAG TPA: hypothetical protein VJR29_09920 [bacterium]|nr:hypothetical protein [bacterium]